MTGHRMSSLEIAQHCGLAPKLMNESGAGRRALMGTYFHAYCAGDPSHETYETRLTPEELAEVREWALPPDVEVGGVTLRYSEAVQEVEVGLSIHGEPCHADDPDLLTLGHLDFAWVHEGVAYVADIKSTEYTVDGPETLQLMAYGYAYAQLMEVDHFCPGIYAAKEGRYTWGEMVPLVNEVGPFASGDLWTRLKMAAENQDTCTGPHCSGCYVRLKCPEHTIRAVEGLGALAPVAEGGQLTAETALDALGMVKAMEDLARQAKKHVQEWARRNGGIPDGKGKKYLPVMTKGRESCSVKRVREVFGPDAEQVISRGASHETWRWVKA